MKLSFIALQLLLSSTPYLACPTCIGLPRPGERPFFERKSFLAAVQQPTAPQKIQTPPSNQPSQVKKLQ